MTTLDPLTEQEFATFFERVSATHADANVAGGRWLAADAAALARDETSRLLPSGVTTPDHHLYAIRPEPGRPLVGYLWFGEMQRGSARIAFVFQVLVLPEHRRLGYARAALQLVHEIAESKGLSSVALHVFAHNEGAYALYRSLGYQVSSLNLVKPLAGDGARQPSPHQEK